jgi:hypothetical protein
MKVRIVLESKEGLCVNFDKIDTIVATDEMFLFKYRRCGIPHSEIITKKDIRYIKVIQERKDGNDN